MFGNNYIRYRNEHYYFCLICYSICMKYNELHQDIRDLAEKTIEITNKLEPSWKSSPDVPYGVRRFNPKHTEDTQRFVDSDRHPETLKGMVEDKKSSQKDIDWLVNIDETDSTAARLMLAITNDENEVVGWTQFYIDEHLTPEQKRELNIPENALIMETSYAKLFGDWPKYSRFIRERDNLDDMEYRGVAVNGLNEAMLYFRHKENIISEEMGVTPRHILITAYTVPENPASEIVLERNGFRVVG